MQTLSFLAIFEPDLPSIMNSIMAWSLADNHAKRTQENATPKRWLRNALNTPHYEADKQSWSRCQVFENEE